jgi:hypothetical protein
VPSQSESKGPKFVLVVKSPTVFVEERAAGTARRDHLVAATGGIDKPVAAATLVTFATPQASPSELDLESIDEIARLAARDGCEVLVWARADAPGRISEAQRRANELKVRAVRAGSLRDSQVVIRITTKAGGQGIDVMVSALRETAIPAALPAATPSSGPTLASGERGKHQIRDAMGVAQQAIEDCVGAHMQKGRLQRAEGMLRLSLSLEGKVQSVRADGAALSSRTLDACLKAASEKWQFPSAPAQYTVDVPVTVVKSGGTS